MMLILDSDGFNDDDAYQDVLNIYQGVARAEARSGPCDDDCEITAPFIDGMPEEDIKFLNKPLEFNVDYEWEHQQAAQRRHDEGVLQSLLASDFDKMMKQCRRLNESERRKSKGKDLYKKR